MMEAAVLVDLDGRPIHWHVPPNRTTAALPDSRPLWDVIWENRERLSGVAHSHPGSGKPAPSYEDVTTFAGVEAALGRRLKWWITSADHLVVLRWAGPERHRYAISTLDETPPWLDRLRELSGYPVSGVPKIEQEKTP